MSDSLFAKYDLSSVLGNHHGMAQKEIDSCTEDYLLNASEADLTAYVVSKVSLEVPQLGEAYMLEPTEVEVDVGHDPMWGRGYGQSTKVKSCRVEVRIPFTGDPDLFFCRPSTFTFSPPHARVGNHVLVLIYDQPGQLNPEQVKTNYEQTVKPIREYLQRVEADAKWLYEIAHALEFPDKGYARHYQHLKSAKLLVPPLPEQRRIVAEIEKQFTRLEAGVAALRRVQANLKRYRAAVLKAACEGRLVPTESEFWNGGSIPWVTSGALNNDFVTEAFEFITPSAIQKTNAKLFPAGTLLVALYGEGKTRGKVSELKIEAATNQACAALLFGSANSAMRPYLKVFLQNNYEAVRLLASGGVQPNLSLSIMKNTVVPLPPLAEQTRIVAEVERRLSVVEELESVVTANLQRATRLRQSILQKAFTGELLTERRLANKASSCLSS